MSEQSEKGYPEESPPGADPDGGDASDETQAREHAENAPDHDDDKATGNPNVDQD